VGVHERRIGMYRDPVQNSTSSQSSFGATHQGSVVEKPFECYQILVFDCVAALIERGAGKGESSAYPDLQARRIALEGQWKEKFESMTHMKERWEMYLVWFKK